MNETLLMKATKPIQVAVTLSVEWWGVAVGIVAAAAVMGLVGVAVHVVKVRWFGHAA